MDTRHRSGITWQHAGVARSPLPGLTAGPVFLAIQGVAMSKVRRLVVIALATGAVAVGVAVAGTAQAGTARGAQVVAWGDCTPMGGC